MPISPTLPVDTLTCDTVLLRQMQQSPAYEYQREFVASDKSLIDWLLDYLANLFDTTLTKTATTDNGNIWPWIGVAVLAVILIYLLKNHEFIFRLKGKDKLDYDIVDEDIYSIDFDKDIDAAVARGSWREATRLTYLKTLRLLADNGRIDWALHKTPTQYTREETSSEFRTMTNEFLRVRYGNFEATESTYAQMRSLATDVAGSILPAGIAADEQKGGDQ